jgi:4-amino-4-deoxy-L-arabinose transferase-like glycosyltransferase
MTPLRTIQSRPVRRSALLLILLASVTFLAGLGRPAIGDSDEGFYAEAGREMVESGDWLTPHYNYEFRFQKPILFYWLVSASYVFGGVGEAQARASAALAGIGLTLVTLVAGRRMFDEATGLLAGAIVATAFGYFSIGRLALPDLPLAFFITVSTLAALAGTVDDDARATRWLVLAGVAAGLGFLTKGPVALVVAALVLVPVWLLERARFRLTLTQALVVFAVALAIGAPWYVAMTLAHGQAYLDSFFIGDNVERFVTSRYNDPRPFWFYLPIVAGGMLPWTPIAAAALPRLWAAARTRLAPRRETVRLLLWALLPLLFFTMSIGKQPRYILPILPPLALLLAREVRERLRSRTGRDGWLQGPAIVIGLLLATMALLLYRARPIVVMVPSVFVLASIVAIGASAALALAVGLARSARWVPLGITLAGTLTLAGLQYGLSPAGRDPVQDMAAIVLRHRTAQEPVATYRVFVRNLIFYTGVKNIDLLNDQHVIDYLRSPARVLCVIDAQQLDRLSKMGALKPRVLGEVLYFNASAVKLRTFLRPEPHRDLERVLLVTNR